MMDNRRQENRSRKKYFDEALSDFVFDAASGRAIRHLVDIGYTTDQILQQLNYPAPRTTVERSVYRYLKEGGIILEELPIQGLEMSFRTLKPTSEETLYLSLAELVSINSEEHSYISCPFGLYMQKQAIQMQTLLSSLTTRERDYILGIAWEPMLVYHRLDHRMLEIGVQLAIQTHAFSFYFLKTKEIIKIQ